MPVDRSELQLVWPPELFASEARALLAAGADDDTFGGLLVEAFHEQRGEQLLDEARSKPVPRKTSASAERIFEWEEPARATEALVAELAGTAEGLRRFTRRALYSSRQRPPGLRLTGEQTKVRFGDLVADLDALGYFEDAFGSHCQDSPDEPVEEGQRKLAARLDLGLGSASEPELWPTKRMYLDWPRRIEADWNDDLFFDLIEALDEVVARPRQRRAHSYHTEWDYGAYHRPAGQAVYRWRVNALLEHSEVGLRLAETGPAAGELVQAAGDPRDRLAEEVPATTSPQDQVAGRPRRTPVQCARRQPRGQAQRGRGAGSGAREPTTPPQARAAQEGRRGAVQHRQRVRRASSHVEAAGRLRRGLPGLGVLVVSRYRRVDRQARGTAGPDNMSPRSERLRVDAVALATQDAVALLDEVPLSAAEAGYVEAARAANTLRGYRSDWREFTAWCAEHGGLDPLPAAPPTVTGYLTALAERGAKVGTMSRRLSAIKFAHQLRDLPDPTRNARVVAVWEGVRRTHGAPPEQAAPLMPPELFDVLAACPSTRIWRTRGREPEPDLAGARDGALLLVGFVGALRRSELAALTVDRVAEHPNGLVLTLPRSKTNQTGEHVELVVLPRAGNPGRCPVVALARWRELAGVVDGPLFRPVGKSNTAGTGRLHPESVNVLVQQAVARAGIDPTRYSAHSLRAGFVTYAHLRGASDRAIAHQTRHRSLATLGNYVRVQQAWTDNAATGLGL